MAKFSFRWGVDLFDNQRTPIPNWILANYHRIEWQGPSGRGVGISNTEMMFIIHLASFKFESERGIACPSLTGTLARRMRYTSNQGIINVEIGLVNKGLLIVEKRPGKTSVYDFTPFSQAIIKVAQGSSTKLDGLSSTKNDDPEVPLSTNHDESRQQNLTRRKEEEKNPTTEEEEPKNTPPSPNPPSLRAQAERGEMTAETEVNLLAGYGRGKQVGVADPSQDRAQFFKYRDEVIQVFVDNGGDLGRKQNEMKARRDALVNFAAGQPEFDLERWQQSVHTCVILGGVNGDNLACMFKTYASGGDYQTMLDQKSNGGKIADLVMDDSPIPTAPAPRDPLPAHEATWKAALPLLTAYKVKLAGARADGQHNGTFVVSSPDAAFLAERLAGPVLEALRQVDGGIQAVEFVASGPEGG